MNLRKLKLIIQKPLIVIKKSLKFSKIDNSTLPLKTKTILYFVDIYYKTDKVVFDGQFITAVQIQCGVLAVCKLFTTFNFINGGY